MVKAIRINEKDNVATVFNDVQADSDVEVLDKKGESEIVHVLDEIPYGHKIALIDIETGQQVTKYGEEIGIASKSIEKGRHVHIHNIESIRGRGDWNKEKQEQIVEGMNKH